MEPVPVLHSLVSSDSEWELPEETEKSDGDETTEKSMAENDCVSVTVTNR